MIAFEIGPFKVAYYGIMIVSGIIAAAFLSHVEAKRRGQDPEHVIRLMLLLLPMGIIGARLYHVIDLWEYYRLNPSLIIGGAGLGIFGALFGGGLGLVIYTIWKKLNPLQWLDILAPGVILAQGIGRWGNFFNQELYGFPTNLPWGIYIAPENRVAGYENFSYFTPLFFYEFIWNILGCAFLLITGRKLQHKLLNGDIFFLYIIWYGIGRFYLEGLKISVWTAGGIPMARWISAIGIILSLSFMVYRHWKNRQTAKEAA